MQLRCSLGLGVNKSLMVKDNYNVDTETMFFGTGDKSNESNRDKYDDDDAAAFFFWDSGSSQDKTDNHEGEPGALFFGAGSDDKGKKKDDAAVTLSFAGGTDSQYKQVRHNEDVAVLFFGGNNERSEDMKPGSFVTNGKNLGHTECYNKICGHITVSMTKFERIFPIRTLQVIQDLPRPLQRKNQMRARRRRGRHCRVLPRPLHGCPLDRRRLVILPPILLILVLLRIIRR
jgi:hypothetical protein